jgi:hypothetical protein
MEPQAQYQSTPDNTLEAVPATWPGGFGIYKYSKQAVMRNLGTIILLIALTIVFSGVLSIFIHNKPADNLVSWIVGAFASGATAYTYLASLRGNKVEVSEAMSKGWHYLINMLLLNLLIGLALIGSLLLFIIPFFFVFPRLLLTEYFLVDKNLDPVEAFKASWQATKGQMGKVLGVVGVGFLMVLLMVTIIGIPLALYFLVMYSAAFAVLYEWINKSASVATTSAASTPPSAPPTES